MTTPDPTVEIKAIRHRLGADFDFDLDRIFADIQERQAASGRKYVTMSPKKINDYQVTEGVAQSISCATGFASVNEGVRSKGNEIDPIE